MKEQHGPGQILQQTHRTSPDNAIYLTTQHNRAMLARQRTTTQQPAVPDVETEEGDYETAWPPRLPTSARRYPIQPGQVITHGNKRFVIHEPVPVQTNKRSRIRFHPLVFVGIGLFVMIIGWLTFSALSSWWQTTQDDIHYGRPRTYQTDIVVGHADSPSNPSHFIAFNLNRHVFVIECPGGDCSKAKIYQFPMLIGNGQNLTPVTITFKDVNGDGKLDMEVHILDQTIIYINTGTDFRPLKPGEQFTP